MCHILQSYSRSWRPGDLESSRHQNFRNFAVWRWDVQLSSGFWVQSEPLLESCNIET